MKKLLVFFILFLLVGCNSDKNNSGLISYMDAKEKIINEGAIVVDVRTEDEYNEKHIDGAILLPLDNINEDDQNLRNKFSGFSETIEQAIDNVSDADYLYYLICSPTVRNAAIKSMVGSSGRQRVQTDVVENLEISVPSLVEQRKIGALLKAIDDKIAVNNNINKNLAA